MPSAINLDTHILVGGLLGNLRPREARLIRRHPAGISAIVLWEIAKLHQKGRITLSLDHPEFAEWLSRIHVWPIDLEVCSRLDDLDFHSDPADELIAATSLAHNVPLLTRDDRIRKSRKVRFA
jgi:PIN domain nuclease of toxin-antitoxin system